MRSLFAFTGIATQISLEKKEQKRLGLEAQAKAEGDPLASRVTIKAGDLAGQTGLLLSWASTDGLVAILLSDGRTVKVQAEEVEKVAENPEASIHTAYFDKLDEEHKQVALENGFQAAVHTPTSDEAVKDITARFLRSRDEGQRVLGEQMLTNRKALAAANAPDADFSRLTIYASVKLRTLGANQNEVSVLGGITGFFSYNTLVAAVFNGEVVRTDTAEVTTERHIKGWLGDREAKTIPQAALDNMAAGLEAAAKKLVVVKAGEKTPECPKCHTEEGDGAYPCDALSRKLDGNCWECDNCKTTWDQDDSSNKERWGKYAEDTDKNGAAIAIYSDASGKVILRTSEGEEIEASQKLKAGITLAELTNELEKRIGAGFTPGDLGIDSQEDLDSKSEGESVSEFVTRMVEKYDLTELSELEFGASQKLKAGITRLRSGKWRDTNGNSYDTLEAAVEAEAAGESVSEFVTRMVEKHDLTELSELEFGASQKLKAGITRLRSGKWRDTNGNSYDTLEQAAEAEAHQHCDQQIDTEGDEYKAQHAAALEEILSNVRASFKLKAGITRLRSGKWRDTNGNSYDTLEQAAEAEAHQHCDQQIDTEGEEYKAQHEAALEEILSNVRASFKRGVKVKAEEGAEGKEPLSQEALDREAALADGQFAGAEGETKGKIEEFEVEDIGVDHSQYFQGRGTWGGKWDAVFVGIGSSFNEAVDDALEMAAMSGYEVTSEIEKEAKSEDPRADVDMVSKAKREHLGLKEEEDIAEDADVSDELWYHVAFYVKGKSSIEGSQKILVAAPAKPMSERTRAVIERALREKEEAKKKTEAPKAEKPGLAPPPDLKKQAEERAKPVKPQAPPYPGIQKPEFRKAKTGEESWKIKHEQPGKVKESDTTGPLTVHEDKPGEVDETKLGKLKEAPEELKALVISSLKRKDLIKAIEANIAKAASDVKTSEGYDEEKKKAGEEDAAIVEMLENITEECATMDSAVLALIRGGLKPKYEFTEEQKKKIAEAAEAQAAMVKEFEALAEKEGRVSYTEERSPKLFTDPSKRKGEGATGLPGADTKKKAGIKSELNAGIMDTLKKALASLKELGKKAIASMKGVTSILEGAAAEEPKEEKKEEKVEARRGETARVRALRARS